MKRVPVSSTSWGSFDGELQTKSTLYTDNISTYTVGADISAHSNIDMCGNSISGIGNNSLAFQSGLNINSDSLGRYIMNAYAYTENDTCSAFDNKHAHSEGENTNASGTASHAEGSYTIASNDEAHAEGYHTTAEGKYSHAGGYYTIAHGTGSNASGSTTLAFGTGSNAHGTFSKAMHDRSYVWSSYLTPVSSTNIGQYVLSALGGIILGGNVDMQGYSISGIGNNSLVFQNGTQINSTKVNNWDSNYSTFGSVSAGYRSDINTLSGNLTNVQTTVQTNSAKWFNIPVVTTLTPQASVTTDLSTGNTFRLTLTGSTMIMNPISATDGASYVWYIKQDNAGSHSISLGNKFVLPSTATIPLAWSTAPSAMDIFAVRADKTLDKFYVISMIGGY